MYFERENKKEEKKQIACPKCGNTDLAFVNVIYSEKKIGFFLIFTIIIAILVLIFFLQGIGSSLEYIIKAETFESKIIHSLSLYNITGVIIDIIFLIILLFAFIKLIPYYNKSEIRYVCKRCGHHANINTINSKENK